MPADDLVNAWKTNLYAEKRSHHRRTNHRFSIREDRADVFSKDYALNILGRDTDSDLWEVGGGYIHTLERTPERLEMLGRDLRSHPRPRQRGGPRAHP